MTLRGLIYTQGIYALRRELPQRPARHSIDLKAATEPSALRKVDRPWEKKLRKIN